MRHCPEHVITGPQGHVLIDGGYPGTPPMILASIAKLGFDINDVKVLLNSEPVGMISIVVTRS